jgi:phosphatidylinositol alpha 1,6-mannosyltransferase
MRIILATDWYYPHLGGVTRQVEGLANALSAKGHHVLVVAPNTGLFESHRSENGIEVWRVPAFNSGWVPDLHLATPSRKRMAKIIKHWHPDLVHVQSHLSVGWSAVLAAETLTIPVIFTYHQFIYYAKGRVWNTVDHWQWLYLKDLYRRCCCVTAPTQLAIDFFTKNYGFGDYLCLSNGLDLVDSWHRQNTRENAKKHLNLDDKRVLLYVGRLSLEKCIPEAIMGFHGYNDDLARYIIRGSGPQQSALEKLGRELGEKRLIFTGGLGKDQLKEYYEAADAFLFPSPIESQGLSALEAMCFSMPILGSQRGAIGGYVSDGINGLTYPPGQPARITQSITNFYQLTADERQSMGDAARQTVQQFDFTIIVDKYINLYDKCIKDHQTDRRHLDPSSAI